MKIRDSFETSEAAHEEPLGKILFHDLMLVFNLISFVL